MNKDEFETKEMMKKILRAFAVLKFLLILNTCLVIVFGFFAIIAAQQAETKVDFRYYLSTKSTEQIEGVYINTYNGEVYKTKEDYQAAISKNPKYKKRGIMQKWFKSLSKGF